MKRIIKKMLATILVCFLLVVPIFVGCSGKKPDPSAAIQAVIQDLKLNYTKNPAGLDDTAPLFSWNMSDSIRGQKQTAYQIIVASTKEQLTAGNADIWDSGKVMSSSSVAVQYNGKELSHMKQYFWTVTVWDKDGKALKPSESASFETGVGSEGFSDAKWIQAKGQGASAPMLRKEFKAESNIASARIYATSAGIYNLYFNGQRVGDAMLTPSWTEYDKRVMYQMYDVTDSVTEGDNAIAVQLGNGWYIGAIASYDATTPAFICKMVITYKNGKSLTIVSDSSWKGYKSGPITSNDIFYGETYDANKEQLGWSDVKFGELNWTSAVETTSKELGMGKIVAQTSGRIKEMDSLKPISVTENPKGKFIYDFGQNFTGVAEITFSGKKGQKVVFRHAEMLNDASGTGDGAEGTIYVANLRTAKSIDTYVIGGEDLVSWHPTMTFHGFRYLEISGLDQAISIENVRAKVLYSDLEDTMEFESSNSLINQLSSNAYWSQRSNFLGVPTDCPQRDERTGWSGDAQVFCGTATYNMNVKEFYDKYITDLNDCQVETGPRLGAYPDIAPGRNNMTYNAWPGHGGWADAGVIIPYTMYSRYGDISMIAKYWDNMKLYIEYLVRDSGNDFVRDSQSQYGDWLAYEPTPVAVTDTAYCVYVNDLMADMARLLGKDDDVKVYENYAKSFRTAWKKTYLNADGSTKSDTQTSYILALKFNIVPSDLKEQVASHLVRKIEGNDWKLSTGFLGVSYLLPVLCDNGYSDVAFKLMEQEGNPSWLYSVLQGATTIWERWDSYSLESGFGDKDMNSFNHYSYGSVMEWMYSTVVGISCDKENPAFSSFDLKPTYGGSMTYAKGSYTSAYGKIYSHWAIEKSDFVYNCTVPANTQAVLYLPGSRDADVYEGNKNAKNNKIDGVKYLGYNNGRHEFAISSGTYSFTTKVSQS